MTSMPPLHTHPHIHGSQPPGEEVVRVSCVRHAYEGGASVALCGLDFVATRGSRVAVLGPNGSGKTTMLFHILGLLKAQEGLVRVFGVDPAADWPAVRRRVGVVLQDVDDQLLMPTVAEDVAFSPRQYGMDEAEVAQRVETVLAQLGITHLAGRTPHTLSGGEKRKVALAGALVLEPELLVLDEPFEGLDPASRGEWVVLLRGLADAGTTVILTTHDMDRVPEFADLVYVLRKGGEIALHGTPEELFANAHALEESNVRPPLLGQLFELLRELDPDAPKTALSVQEAARRLAAWKHGETPSS